MDSIQYLHFTLLKMRINEAGFMIGKANKTQYKSGWVQEGINNCIFPVSNASKLLVLAL